MSGKLVGLVLENAPEDLTPAEFTVLIAVAEDARDKDRIARYSDTESLVRRTRKKPGTVRNAMSVLVARGLLVPLHDHVHRGGRHQEYEITELRTEHRTAVNGHAATGDTAPKLRRIQ